MRYLFLVLVAVLLGCADGDRAVGPVEGPAVKGLSVADADSTEAVRSPAEARVALARLGIAYTEDVFLAAALSGEWEVVRLFVQAGMSVDEQWTKWGMEGRTVLHVAAAAGNLEMVQFLVERGANIYIRTNRYNTGIKLTPLGAAARAGHFEVVKYLASVDEAARNLEEFRNAVRAGDLEVVKLFVELGLSVDDTDSSGVTALMAAAWNGHLDVARYLAEQGADINARDNSYGWTALHWAAGYGYLEIVEFLVGAGADMLATDNEGETARDRARARGHSEIAEYLASVGG